MKLRWIIVFLLIFAIGVAGIVMTACTLSGDVVLTSKDSFRFISPDFELHPKVCNTETTIDNDDDDSPDKEEKK